MPLTACVVSACNIGTTVWATANDGRGATFHFTLLTKVQ